MALVSAPGAVEEAAERGDGTGSRPGRERALRGGRGGSASRRGSARETRTVSLGTGVEAREQEIKGKSLFLFFLVEGLNSICPGV